MGEGRRRGERARNEVSKAILGSRRPEVATRRPGARLEARKRCILFLFPRVVYVLNKRVSSSVGGRREEGEAYPAVLDVITRKVLDIVRDGGILLLELVVDCRRRGAVRKEAKAGERLRLSPQIRFAEDLLLRAKCSL